MDTGVAGSVQDWQASKNSAGVWKFKIKAKLEHTAQASFKCGMLCKGLNSDCKIIKVI